MKCPLGCWSTRLDSWIGAKCSHIGILLSRQPYCRTLWMWRMVNTQYPMPWLPPILCNKPWWRAKLGYISCSPYYMHSCRCIGREPIMFGCIEKSLWYHSEFRAFDLYDWFIQSCRLLRQSHNADQGHAFFSQSSGVEYYARCLLEIGWSPTWKISLWIYVTIWWRWWCNIRVHE